MSAYRSPEAVFLLSPITLACVAVRIAPFLSEPQFMRYSAAIQSMLIRPVQHDSISLFQSTKSWTLVVPLSLSSVVTLILDLLTALALVRWASSIQRSQENDEEEMVTREKMPAAIRPQHKVFATSRKEEDCLLSRDDLVQLTGHLYFWGTAYASASQVVYKGLLWGIVRSLMPWNRAYSAGDPLVAAFLIPTYRSFPPEYRKLPLQVLFLVTAAIYLWFNPPSTALPTFSTPNLGVQWYFTMQLFDRFRSYFGIMLSGIRFLLILPLAMRLQNQVELTIAYSFCYTIFQPWPTVTDVAVTFSLLLLSPRTLARMGLPSLISLCSMPVPLILYVVDWDLWIHSGSGNANYIYFQCLAWNAFVAIIFLDFVGAAVKRQTALELTGQQLDNVKE